MSVLDKLKDKLLITAEQSRQRQVRHAWLRELMAYGIEQRDLRKLSDTELYEMLMSIDFSARWARTV